MKNEQEEKTKLLSDFPDDHKDREYFNEENFKDLLKIHKTFNEVYVNPKQTKKHGEKEKYFLLHKHNFMKDRKVFKYKNVGKNFIFIDVDKTEDYGLAVLDYIQKLLDNQGDEKIEELIKAKYKDISVKDENGEIKIYYNNSYLATIKNKELYIDDKNIKDIGKGDHITLFLARRNICNGNDFYKAIYRIRNDDLKKINTLYCKNCAISKGIVNFLQEKMNTLTGDSKPKVFVSSLKKDYEYIEMEAYDKEKNDIVGIKTMPTIPYADILEGRNITNDGLLKVDLKDVNKNKYKYFDYYCITKDKIYKVPYDLVKNRVKLIDSGKFDEEFEKATKIECECGKNGFIVEKHQQIYSNLDKDNLLSEEDKQNLKNLQENENKIKHFRTDKSRYNDALISFIKTSEKQNLEELFNENKDKNNDNINEIKSYDEFIKNTFEAIKINEFDNGWGRNSILKKKLQNIKPENTIETIMEYIKDAEKTGCSRCF